MAKKSKTLKKSKTEKKQKTVEPTKGPDVCGPEAEDALDKLAEVLRISCVRGDDGVYVCEDAGGVPLYAGRSGSPRAQAYHVARHPPTEEHVLSGLIRDAAGCMRSVRSWHVPCEE